MRPSTSTPPTHGATTPWTPELEQQFQQWKAQKDSQARVEASKPGNHPLVRALGLGVRSVTDAVTGTMQAALMGQLVNPMTPGLLLPLREQVGAIQQGGRNVTAATERAGIPQPETPGEVLATRTGTGLAGALPFGGAAMLPGAVGGLAQGAGEVAGLPPQLQALVALLAGGGAGALQRGVAQRGPLQAANAFDDAATANNQTLASVLRTPAGPETPGVVRTGRPGTQVGLDVAAGGGRPADAMNTMATDRLTRYEQAVATSRGAEAERVLNARAQERSVLDFSKQQTRSAQRSAQHQSLDQRRAARAETRAAEEAATRSVAGDQVAARYERAVGTPHRTLLQYERLAEQDLQNTGRRVFGALERRMGTASSRGEFGQLQQTDGGIAPHESTAPIFEALADPIVGQTYRRYAPSVEHNPTFPELQKTYQALGAQVRQAARNGGALPDGTLMTDLRNARETLSQAMERAIPGFREANAAYRGKATVLEALTDGYLAGKNGKAPDIQDELTRLAEIDPDAVQAHLVGQRLAVVDQLREMPSSRAAAERFLSPGSDMAERLRLAFPDDASYQRFTDDLRGQSGARGQPSVALERSLTGLRQSLQRQVDDIAQQGSRQRAEIRDLSAREVAGIRQGARAERDALPKDDLHLMRQIQGAAKGLPSQTNATSTRGMADLGAGRPGPAKRDLLLTLLREVRLPRAARERVVRVLTTKGAEFEREADLLLQDLQTIRSIVPQGMLGGAGAAGAALGRDSSAARRE